MEKWQKDFSELVGTVADEVEQFFVGVTEMVDSLFEISEELAEQLQTTIITELDQYLNDLAEPLFEAYWELDDVTQLDQPFSYIVEPTPQKNPACIGCRHYHGQVHGGNLLICAMHPYGWEDEKCPDWQQSDYFS
ncbi:hypothetical protein [Chroococcidiopsis sp. CCMEE 29]|uniref:hypothetical protein n=1 Tax=Chroococcidiopsis sp. CCMEE 29 TaxID=155894 RepID=UPI00201FC0CE|nr:hypothetical protein [Chroococcidiopsis sp. CCMEE 29]